MRRLHVVLLTGLGVLAVAVATGFAASRLDQASAHAALRAWLPFNRAELGSLPRARKALARFSSSIAADCPSALKHINSTPVDSINWRALSPVLAEINYDADIVAIQPLRSPFTVFASKVGQLRWSKKASAAEVKSSLRLERGYLLQRTSNLCADAKALAAKSDTPPAPSVRFTKAAVRRSRLAGLGGLSSVVGVSQTRADFNLSQIVFNGDYKYQDLKAKLVSKEANKVARALGLTEPEKVIALDDKATSNARNMVSQVESCYTDTEDYSMCRTPTNTGLPMGSGRGQVEVTEATKETYTVVAHSESGTDFTVTKRSSGTTTRTCSRPYVADCGAGGRW